MYVFAVTVCSYHWPRVLDGGVFTGVYDRRDIMYVYEHTRAQLILLQSLNCVHHKAIPYDKLVISETEISAVNPRSFVR